MHGNARLVEKLLLCCNFVGSADSGIADQPCISPEMRVLQEVMDTETVYVSDLGEVIEVSFMSMTHRLNLY